MRKKNIVLWTCLWLLVAVVACGLLFISIRQRKNNNTHMQLGNFSVGLSVKNIGASRAFYEKLGFSAIMGKEEEGWLIMKNGSTNIGLFQGMFEKNTLTFNPGWDQDGKEVFPFDDVREIQQNLKAAGIALDQEAAGSSGPASLMITDPDGNPILIDQHVEGPKGEGTY